MASLVLEPAGALSAEQLARVRVIYEDAFGSHLRVPFAELTRAGDVDRTFVALEGPAAVGFAALRRLGSVRWSYLRYFAVAAIYTERYGLLPDSPLVSRALASIVA